MMSMPNSASSSWGDEDRGTQLGRLTTHVLDTATGRPAAGLSVSLFRQDGEALVPLASGVTNDDGRVVPIVEGDDFTAGVYELRFACGDYLRSTGAALTDPPFLDLVPIRFGIGDAGQHYHVPLLISAFGYSTYRGS